MFDTEEATSETAPRMGGCTPNTSTTHTAAACRRVGKRARPGYNR